MKKTGPTNPTTQKIIKLLKKQSNEKKVKIWKDIAERLEKPSRIIPSINVSKIDKNTIEKDTIIVPGKVLGDGNIKKQVTVCALKISETAKEKIKTAGGNYITIEELINKNPKGSKIKIMS